VAVGDDEPTRVSHGFVEVWRHAYPQANQRKETTLARQVADSGRRGDPAPAAQAAGSPSHAGKAAKKKGPEIIRALVDGGGGDNHTDLLIKDLC
jgi:hypothetical protein